MGFRIVVAVTVFCHCQTLISGLRTWNKGRRCLMSSIDQKWHPLALLSQTHVSAPTILANVGRILKLLSASLLLCFSSRIAECAKGRVSLCPRTMWHTPYPIMLQTNRAWQGLLAVLKREKKKKIYKKDGQIMLSWVFDTSKCWF